MSDEKKYDDEGSGYLWHENDATIERKGSFVLNGKKEYGALVKSFNNKNEVKYEFLVSLGLMHINTDKKSERSPDMGGKITFNGEVYKLGCWAKETQTGTPFTSLGFDKVDEQENPFVEKNEQSNSNDDLDAFKPPF